MSFRLGNHRIAITIPDRAALLDEVQTRLRDGRGFALATLNLDHLVKLSRSPGYREIYAAQDLVVADGNPVVWLSRVAGRPVALVPGADLVIPLARLAAQEDVSIALVGSTAPVLERAANVLQDAAPGLRVAATIAPRMGFDPDGPEAAAIVGQIVQSGARLCLVAMGAPRQEAFARLGRALAPQIGFASIGAGLDFLAHAQRRAPPIARRLALEWLWRLLTDPRRLTLRYTRCALLLPSLVHGAWQLRSDTAKPPGTL